MAVVKISQGDPLTAERDHNIMPGNVVVGWYSERTGTIYLVVGRLREGQRLYRLVMHEMGHAVGLGHTTSEHALMSPIFSNSDVTVADLELCRAAKLCP